MQIKPLVCSKKLFVAFPWVVTSTGPGGFMVVCVFYDELPKAQPKVVLWRSLLHWLSVFTLIVPPLSVLHSNKTVNTIT